jgi:hypothetical protein
MILSGTKTGEITDERVRHVDVAVQELPSLGDLVVDFENRGDGEQHKEREVDERMHDAGGGIAQQGLHVDAGAEIAEATQDHAEREVPHRQRRVERHGLAERVPRLRELALLLLLLGLGEQVVGLVRIGACAVIRSHPGIEVVEVVTEAARSTPVVEVAVAIGR